MATRTQNPRNNNYHHPNNKENGFLSVKCKNDTEPCFDTEDADTMPTEYSEYESQHPSEKEPWGRLHFKTILRKGLGLDTGKQVFYNTDKRDYIEIKGKEFCFGRDPSACQFVLKKDSGLDVKSWNRVSKVHFKLYRESFSDSSPIIIEDLSRNGTFLNGVLIGQHNKQLIRSTDVISVVHAGNKMFDFMDIVVRPKADIPDEMMHRYFISKKIGSGAFGDVFKVVDRDLKTFAVKYIKGATYSANLEFTNQSIDNEIRIMKKISHACIIKTMDVVKHPIGGCSLVLELMEGGDLLHRILSKKFLPEEPSRCFFYQICDAIKYLHRQGITHRDIKPENILCKDNNEFTLVKLSDFGLSKIFTEGTLKSQIGTPNYIAPEILMPEFAKYTPKVDIWSMGVVLFAMVSGTLPFSDDYGDVGEQVKRGKYRFLGSVWKGVSRECIMLIQNMLVVNPDERIQTHEIFMSNWMHPSNYGIKAAKRIVELNAEKHTTITQEMQRMKAGEEGFRMPYPVSKRLRKS